MFDVMSPITHFFAGWLVANLDDLNRRDRLLVTLAGIVPDLDGLGIVPDFLTRHSAQPLNWWSDYHHLFGHNLLFGLAAASLGFAVATKRPLASLLILLTFHLHLLGDVVGGRGPDGYSWPIPYGWPFTAAWTWQWSGQWALNASPNFVITAFAIGLTLFLAVKRGFSPLEMVSPKADAVVVATLRRRFSKTGGSSNP